MPTFCDHISSQLRDWMTVDDVRVEELDSIDITEFANNLEALVERVDDLFSEDQSSFVGELNELFTKSANLAHVDDILGAPLRKIALVVNLCNILAPSDCQTDRHWDSGPLHLNQVDKRLEIYQADNTNLEMFGSGGTKHLNTGLIYYSFQEADELSFFNKRDYPSGDYSKLLFQIFITRLCNYNEELSGKVFILCSAKQRKIAEYFARFHAVYQGFILNRRHQTGQISGMDQLASALLPSRQLFQYSEPLGIMSEINTREFTLEKYLSSYHALENYMIRGRIAKISSQSGGKIFKIRDFRRLSIFVEGAESVHLKSLVDKLWEKSICGEKLIDFTVNLVDNATTTANWNQNVFDEFCSKLEFVDKNHKAKRIYTKAEIKENFSQLIYMVRCSIVHHKETEFHISNKNLEDETISILFERLLLPFAMRIAFALPTVKNENPIKYESSSISLY